MDQPLKFGFIPIGGGSYYSEFLAYRKHMALPTGMRSLT